MIHGGNQKSNSLDLHYKSPFDHVTTHILEDVTKFFSHTVLLNRVQILHPLKLGPRIKYREFRQLYYVTPGTGRSKSLNAN